MDTSELTALTSSSGGPGPGGANVPDFVVPATTVAAVFPTGAVEVGSVVATSVGNSISNSNSNDKVTLNVNDQSKAAGSGPSPAVIGIGAGVGLLLLGAIGFVVVRRRSQAKRSERRSQLYGVYDQQEPVRFEAPLPPPPPPASEKSASAIATPLSPVSSVKKNAAFNNAKPVQLAALERSPSVSSSSNKQQQIQQPFYGMPNQQQQLQSQQQQGQFAQPFNNAQYVQQPQYSQQPALFSPVVGAAPFAYPPGPQAGAYNPQQPQQHPGYYDANGNYHFYAQQ
ncbi:hypothetical protein BDR26DRAFT_871794 [Obelidium mucronatum]|nr:hypothetical protein BDR26DRAFT_871794 [Obelidium mucronatum]